MQQIADWLEQLGMSEYAERFSENKIDVSVLRHLTDQDLKDIGAGQRERVPAQMTRPRLRDRPRDGLTAHRVLTDVTLGGAYDETSSSDFLK
jgi:SAM domain (Sterile alpha motif)